MHWPRRTTAIPGISSDRHRGALSFGLLASSLLAVALCACTDPPDPPGNDEDTGVVLRERPGSDAGPQTGADATPDPDADNTPDPGPGDDLSAERATRIDPSFQGQYPGGNDAIPRPRATTADQRPDGSAPPDCGAACLKYCRGLDLQNPVNRGLCESLWGVGLDHRPLRRNEACRRLYADTIGRFPTRAEVQACRTHPWAKTVWQLIDTEDFALVNRRWWADRLMYNNIAVSFERIFEADEWVAKLYRGDITYDRFGEVISAHPVLTRRHANAGDRAEAAFRLLMGRPPLGRERSDLARLYNLWNNGYHDHPELGARLPDAFLLYRCLTDDHQQADPRKKGECTSILWGYHELILFPDGRAHDKWGAKRLWSGDLTAEEWQKLQLSGRILAEQPAFWETAVDRALRQYLDYDLGTKIPRVRSRLVDYLLEHGGDVRALHYAILTSFAYRQSAQAPLTSTTRPGHRAYRWTWGPLKQVQAETWIDSIEALTGFQLGDCDHRLPVLWRLENTDRAIGERVLKQSRWEFDPQTGRIDREYMRLARSLGGCPPNDASSRFRITSILTTARQLKFVEQVCDPAVDPRMSGAELSALIPEGLKRNKAVTPAIAERIVDHQIRKFYGRPPNDAELRKARRHGEQCSRMVCDVEEFARPSCYALLSSSEMLFY